MGSDFKNNYPPIACQTQPTASGLIESTPLASPQSPELSLIFINTRPIILPISVFTKARVIIVVFIVLGRMEQSKIKSSTISCHVDSRTSLLISVCLFTSIVTWSYPHFKVL